MVNKTKKEKIAIVGLSCRFPGGANSPEEYWEILEQGKDVVTEVSSDRWGTDFYYHPDKEQPGKSYTFSAGVLDDVDKFDAGFFNISPREAAQMDPQQRLLLELTWEALENGHQKPKDIAGSNCAVYVGIASTDYGHRRMDDLSSLDPYTMTGNTASIASNRISYNFNLNGPSVSVDTACSSSLVALHQACESLWSGTSDSAITGGVNMLLHPYAFVGFSKASMLSPNGRCKAFDESGDGYVRSEGAAVLYLKRLSDAERDGDPIHAVILNTGINSDGKTNGITLPSRKGQSSLLERVYKEADIDVNDIDYFEAHGTGTRVGDPQEAGAIANVISSKRKSPLLIGSAKTNVGHLETASGMAGLLKVVMSLKNRTAPVSLHFNTPNKNIDFEKDQLEVVTKKHHFNDYSRPLLMGINSFGFGGANAHAIIEEYSPESAKKQDKTSKQNLAQNQTQLPPLFLSANSQASLRLLAKKYYQRVFDKDESDYSEIAYATFKQKQLLKYNVCFDAPSLELIHDALLDYSNETKNNFVFESPLVEAESKMVLVFSGNGSQWFGMAKSLLQNHSVFAKGIDEVQNHLNNHSDLNIKNELLADENRLELTEIAQPLLFAIQVAYVRVLQSQGFHADAVIGHSVGEVAAAWASGYLDLAQATSVIYHRSQAQGETKGGGRMAAAGLSAEDGAELLSELSLDDVVFIAGINSPSSITLSGDLTALEALVDIFEALGKFYRILDLDYAFHSPDMDSIESALLDSLSSLDINKTPVSDAPFGSQCEYISTVTGKPKRDTLLDKTYWWKNIREPVLFEAGISHLIKDGFKVFVEIGPHPILKHYVSECAKVDSSNINYIEADSRSAGNVALIDQVIFKAYMAGSNQDVSQTFTNITYDKTLSIPSYAWNKQTYWYQLTAEGGDLVNRHRHHELLGYRLDAHSMVWENQIDAQSLPYIGDHEVDGVAVMPAAAYIEIALLAADEIHQTKTVSVENVEILSPILLDKTKVIRFEYDELDGAFTISSRQRLSDEAWSLNVKGRILGKSTIVDSNASTGLFINQFIKRSSNAYSKIQHYHFTESVGLNYGPAFQAIDEIWVESKSALARLKLPKELKESQKTCILHPSYLDAGFQMLVDVYAEKINLGKQAALIPVQITKLAIYEDLAELSYIQMDVVTESPQSVVANFKLYDVDGVLLGTLQKCRFRAVHLAQRSNKEIPSYQFTARLKPHLNSGQTSSVPNISLVSNTVKRRLDAVTEELRAEHINEVIPLFDLMVAQYSWQAFSEILPVNQALSFDEMVEQHGLVAELKPYITTLLKAMVEDGLAEYDEKKWTISAISEYPEANNIWLSILGDSPEYLPELMILGRIGKNLAEALVGNIPVEQLMPSDSSAIYEHWYASSASNKYVNQALENTIKELIVDWPENKRIRILEIGSSYLDLTRQILTVLPEDKTDYLYVHSDQEALLNVKFDLGDYEFVKTLCADINDGIPEALYDEVSTYDILLAGNSLFAMNDLSLATNVVQKLLRPSGVLLMLERNPDRFMDFAFGIDSDWWAHADESSDPSSLLLSYDDWLAHLKESKFSEFDSIKEETENSDSGAFLMLATHENLTAQVVSKDNEQLIKTWLILKDSSEVSSSLSTSLQQELTSASQTIISVDVADKYQRTSDSAFSIDKADMENGIFNVLSTLQKTSIQIDETVHVAGLKWHDDIDLKDSHDVKNQALRCASLLGLVKAIDEFSSSQTPKLNVITSGGALFENSVLPEYQYNPSESKIWGFSRVVQNELPQLNTRMIDLQGAFSSQELTHKLVVELLSVNDKSFEPEVILGLNERHVLRMIACDIETAQPVQSHYKLGFSAPGLLKNLEWQATKDVNLGANQIEIQPYAAGLNFRDVMYAMGLLSDEALENGFAGATLGMELAGKVIACGSDVTEFKNGDDVLGFAPACFSSSVITDTTAISLKPKSWSYQESATIPTTFFTVYYALNELANLRKGEKILIHGAAGGVGIAAIQYARYKGAVIFATAGSDEKRDFVKMLGADYVMDSRSYDFAEEILALTNQEGVDIVLNSLAKEAINRNLSVLKPFGRFLELGKRDFYENSKIGLRPFRNNISYFGIDADQLLIERPDLAKTLFKEMMSLFDEGHLRPLPHRIYPATRIEDAFKYMQQSKQIGKVVVSFNEAFSEEAINLPIKAVNESIKALNVNSDKSYIITGGFGGFGLKTAQWLVSKGAKSLILMSRSGKATAENQTAIDDLINQGVQVYQRSCDVTKRSEIASLINQVKTDGLEIGGVIHAAMVLNDTIIKNMSEEQLSSVLLPKVNGAYYLHELTLESQLDFFVLYSSATTFVGNPGQANYVAANAYLESLIQLRHSKGLVGTYAAWGAIDDVGYLSNNLETKEALQSRLGGKALNSTMALAMLEKLLVNQSSGAAIIDLDWNVIQRVMPSARSLKYLGMNKLFGESDSNHIDIHSEIAELDFSQTEEFVSDLLLDEVEQILRLSKDKIKPDVSINEQGMDSLMGMELGLAIESKFDVKLPAMVFSEGATINRIAERITEKLKTPDSSKQTVNKINDEHLDVVGHVAKQHGSTTEVDQKSLAKEIKH